MTRFTAEDLDRANDDGSIGVYDCNAMRSTEAGDGWVALADWSSTIVPAITADISRATGGWHITHAIEVGP